MAAINVTELRRKQLLFINGSVITSLIAVFSISSWFQLSFTAFFLPIGILFLFLSIIGWMKGDSVKRIVPLLEQIAIYEKRKMGEEWKKEKKVEHVTRFILAFILFYQYSLQARNGPGEIDYAVIIPILLLSIAILNGGLIYRFRKIDRAASPEMLEGHTKKSTIRSVVVGFLAGLIIFVLTVFLILLTI